MKKIKFLSLILVVVIVSACCFALVSCNKEDVKRDDVFSQDTYFDIDFKHTDIAAGAVGGAVLDVASKAVLDREQSYFVFRADGTCHGQLATSSKMDVLGIVDTVMGLMGGSSEPDPNAAPNPLTDGGSIEEFVNMYAEPFFPGFSKALYEDADPQKVVDLIQKGLGLSLKATYPDPNDPTKKLDVFKNEKFLEAIKYIGENNKCLPENVLSYIPAGAQIFLTFDEPYNIQTLKNYKGEEVKAIFVGNEVKDNPYTQPFGVFTLTEDEDGLKHASLVIEVVVTKISLVERVAKD